ncbi:MAG: hypothetical protein DRP09_10215 [Candidatus Thorarchaeota archaeon]|nr:MAG: hypothetical protein DRP09_10215 [Candidatus Thorarchaeota archaeon]
MDKEVTDVLKKLGDEHGYGNLMATASVLWQAVLGKNKGGAYTVGPCAASLVPCECKDDFKTKCDWCAGTHMVTKRVKEAKDEILGRKPKAPPEEYTIEKSLLISKYHISEKDWDGISKAAHMQEDKEHLFDVASEPITGGYALTIDPKVTMPEYKGYSPQFKRVIRVAKKQKCKYIKIINDGPIYDELEILNWKEDDE